MLSGAWIDQLRLHWRRPTAAQMQHWPSGTRLLALARANVRVRDVGAGPRTVLLSPDPPVVLESYERLIELLSPHMRVVCFEFPGCGFSYPLLGFNFTLADHVAIVREAMDHLDIDHATLAFTGVNALHAIAFAHAHPARVNRLVVAQVASTREMRSFAKRIAFRISGVNVLTTPVLGQLLLASRRDLVVRSWFRAAAADAESAERLYAVSRAVLADGGEFCLASISQSAILEDAEGLKVAGCPAHVTWGDADRTHRRTCKTSIQVHMPQATIGHYPDCGHFPDLDAPLARPPIKIPIDLSACGHGRLRLRGAVESWDGPLVRKICQKYVACGEQHAGENGRPQLVPKG